MPIPEDIRRALTDCANRGEDEMFDCSLEVLKQVPPEACGPRLVMLTEAACEACADEQQDLAPDIDAGLIVPVDRNSEEGRRIVSQMKAAPPGAPVFLFVDCDGKVIDLDEAGNSLDVDTPASAP